METFWRNGVVLYKDMMFWRCSGDVLELFGDLLETLWRKFGDILETFDSCSGDTRCSGIILELSWRHFGVVLETF